MKTLSLLLILLLSFLNNCGLIAVGKDKEQLPTRYETLYDQLMNLKADPNQVAMVNNIVIKRDAGTFTLNSGNLFLCQPIDNKIRACIFIGDGIFSFDPPNDIERGQIQRTFEMDRLVKEIRYLLLFFADTTLKELTSSLTFGPAEVPSNVPLFIKEMLKYQGETDGKNADHEIMKTLFEENNSGLFYAQFKGKSGAPLMFVINPYEDEEVILMQRRYGYVFRNSKEIVSQFPLKKYNSEIARQKNWFQVERYFLNCHIFGKEDFSATAKIIFCVQQNDHKWLSFKLASKLEVDSVTSCNNTNLQFYKGEDNPLLWVELPKSLKNGETDTIQVYYHGDIIEKEGGYIFIKSSNYWFPRCHTQNVGKMKKAFFDITYHYPSSYTLVSVGKQTSYTSTEDEIISRWVTEKPVSNISFNIGRFKQHRMTKEGQPPVTILASGQSDYKMDEDVGFDISNSITFYQNVYGKCPVDSLFATEIPYLHGEAFPGLLHLSAITFRQSDDISFDTQFRAHEVAHQWWGISVDFESYHDQWLSEGFADYSGLWYTQIVLKDNKKFFEMLTDYKRSLLEARKYLFSKGQQTGPIYLGYRNDISSTKGDYSRIVYEKAAWILHMIRNMMIDLKTMNEDSFIGLMKNFYSTYRGSKVTTADFQKMIEQYTGEDMTWFFDQWIYGIEIPTYKFDYTTSKTTDGKFKVHCKIKTENVSESFKMPVPLLILFNDDQYARLRVFVQGKSCEFDLPLLPLEPDKIVFNDLESVLCDVE